MGGPSPRNYFIEGAFRAEAETDCREEFLVKVNTQRVNVQFLLPVKKKGIVDAPVVAALSVVLVSRYDPDLVEQGVSRVVIDAAVDQRPLLRAVMPIYDLECAKT